MTNQPDQQTDQHLDQHVNQHVDQDAEATCTAPEEGRPQNTGSPDTGATGSGDRGEEQDAEMAD